MPPAAPASDVASSAPRSPPALYDDLQLSLAEAWRLLGDRLGEAFQVADDLRDAVEDEASIGKPVGRDKALGRPSAVLELGLQGAVARLKLLADAAVEAIPECRGRAVLRGLMLEQVRRLLPQKLAAA